MSLEEDDDLALDIGLALGPDIESLELVTIAEEAIAKVSKAMGEAPEWLSSVRVYRATGPEGPLGEVAIVPATGLAEDATQLLVGVGASGRFSGAAVVDEDYIDTGDYTKFLEQLRFKDPARIKGASPPSILSEEPDGAPADRAGLIQLMRAMQDQAAAFNLPRAEADAAIPGMAAAFERAAAPLELFAEILGDERELFEKNVTEAIDAAQAIEANREIRDMQAMRAAHQRLMVTCKACHFELKDRFVARREELGIGDGFFQIGYDLRIAHSDREKAQEVADRLRAASLLIDVSHD